MEGGFFLWRVELFKVTLLVNFLKLQAINAFMTFLDRSTSFQMENEEGGKWIFINVEGGRLKWILINVEGDFFCGGWNFSKLVSMDSH